jgi:hypothetical protein
MQCAAAGAAVKVPRSLPEQASVYNTAERLQLIYVMHFSKVASMLLPWIAEQGMQLLLLIM